MKGTTLARPCEPFAMRRTRHMFGVGAATDDPLIRSPRSWRKQRTSAEIAGAVSAVPALVLDLLATPKSAASRMAGSGDRCQDSDMPPTVLIVDDHPSFRLTARALLEAEGFDIIGEAEDGESAIEAARRLHPEVVLLDVQLPDIDGFDVAARLTGDPNAPTVILVSSRDGSDFGPLVSRSGARGFVPKAELSGDRVQELLP
jgi:CheY-like chemotaxis protein